MAAEVSYRCTQTFDNDRERASSLHISGEMSVLVIKLQWPTHSGDVTIPFPNSLPRCAHLLARV